MSDNVLTHTSATSKKSSLMPVDMALKHIMAKASCCASIESIALQHAYGRVLADNQYAQVNVPPADNSAMDGYALRQQDADKILPMSQRIAAGDVPQPLTPHTCAQVFTGAEIPQGADLVVMQEDTEVNKEGIRFINDPKVGAFIRRQGQDMIKGNQVVSKGTLVTARHLGVLAAAGISHVSVYRPLKVAILSTGSELVDLGQPLQTGQIYNSNRYQLIGLLTQLGIDVVDMGMVKDNIQATTDALTHASQQADLIITSGGMSVGEEDYVKSCVQALGQLHVWKLAIKPGKPLAFGEVKGVPFFGLPGNPASVLVTFMVIVKPYLLALQGIEAKSQIQHQAILCNPPKRTSSRPEYLRVKCLGHQEGVLQLEALSNQNSGVISTAIAADGLALVPADTRGDNIKWVDYIPFNSFP